MIVGVGLSYSGQWWRWGIRGHVPVAVGLGLAGELGNRVDVSEGPAFIGVNCGCGRHSAKNGGQVSLGIPHRIEGYDRVSFHSYGRDTRCVQGCGNQST